jgi:hypothetical protein
MIFINANFPQNILINSILFIDVTSLYTDPDYNEKSQSTESTDGNWKI